MRSAIGTVLSVGTGQIGTSLPVALLWAVAVVLTAGGFVVALKLQAGSRRDRRPVGDDTIEMLTGRLVFNATPDCDWCAGGAFIGPETCACTVPCAKPYCAARPVTRG